MKKLSTKKPYGGMNMNPANCFRGAVSGLIGCALLAFSGQIYGLEVEGKATPPGTSRAKIESIQLIGPPVIVFDHLRDQQEPYHLPDETVNAWKDSHGTVNLTIPHFENYRMRGPTLESLVSDPMRIFSSTTQAEDITEDHYDYHHWLISPYTLDGKTVYALTHTEWYACLLEGDCSAENNMPNSWVTSNNSFKSDDGGATWSANGLYENHLIANLGNYWTGSQELALRVYQTALNHSGFMAPSRLIKEGAYYYSVGWELHRDFSMLDTTTGEAPIDKYGFAIIRTKDITEAAGWEAWVAGNTFQAVSAGSFGVFLPQENGLVINPGQAQLIYDLNAKTYILFFSSWDHNAIYYITTKRLASPSWSEAKMVLGSDTFQVDPRNPDGQNPCNIGFVPNNYVSVIDSDSPGLNFEFTSGSPWLFYVVNPALCGGDNLARDLYRVRLSIKYSR
jgi:hypothetical protein